MYIFCPSIHPLMDTWVASTFWLLLVNNADMNVAVQISLQGSAFSYFVDIPRRGIAVLYDNSIFNFLRTLHTVFRKGCIITLKF